MELTSYSAWEGTKSSRKEEGREGLDLFQPFDIGRPACSRSKRGEKALVTKEKERDVCCFGGGGGGGRGGYVMVHVQRELLGSFGMIQQMLWTGSERGMCRHGKWFNIFQSREAIGEDGYGQCAWCACLKEGRKGGRSSRERERASEKESATRERKKEVHPPMHDGLIICSQATQLTAEEQEKNESRGKRKTSFVCFSRFIHSIQFINSFFILHSLNSFIHSPHSSHSSFLPFIPSARGLFRSP